MRAVLRACAFAALVPAAAAAQGPASPLPAVAAAAQVPAPPPATKLESFKPSAGTIVTFGYDELGYVSGVSVDVRELRDARNSVVRGVVVEISQGQYRTDRSFIDADELPELLRGIDALLAVPANPTSFKQFEVRYTTKGDFRLTAYNARNGRLAYSATAGRTPTASSGTLDANDVRKLRGMFEAAQAKFAEGAPGHD